MTLYVGISRQLLVSCPSWSLSFNCRWSVACTVIGRWMTCEGTLTILYPGGTAGKNSWIVCTRCPLIYAPMVMLHSIRKGLTLKMVTGKSDVWVTFAERMRGVNLSRRPMESSGLKSIGRLHLISLRRVLLLGCRLMEMSWADSTFCK